MTVVVTLLPEPLPSREDPTTFADRADAVMAQLNDTLTQLNEQNEENNDMNVAIANALAMATDLVETVEANETNINTVSANIASVITVAANILTVVAAGNDIANINAVAGALSNIAAAVADLPALAAKVSKTGDTMTGHLEVPAGAAGAQAPRASETLLKANDLNDLVNAATARTNLGLGSAATRTALGSTGSLYSRDSVLATVSQSGGVPTGGLIETGSNANGSYVRFADGTQICWFTEATNRAVNQAQGTLYISAAANFTYPAVFFGNPVVRALAYNSANAPTWADNAGPGNTSTGPIYGFAAINTATTRLGYIAIGRWF